MRPTVVFDFDGVIHSYLHDWQGTDVIPDPPVEGIREAIAEIRKQYAVIVVSTRCYDPNGKRAVENYLVKNGIEVDAVMAEKPPAVAYIDDRAICFDGEASTLLDKITNFVPWNKPRSLKLNPCPFCGKFPKIAIIRLNGRYDGNKLTIPVTIRCDGCGVYKNSTSTYRIDWMGNSIREKDGMKELSEWWNERTLPFD